MEPKLRFKDREKVFNFKKLISFNTIGAIAQNEMVIRETDILLEFIRVDQVINSLQEYKKLIISNIEQV